MSDHSNGDIAAQLLVTAILIAVSFGFVYFMAKMPRAECTETETRLLPVYAQGPKHHIHGPLKGYVEREVCVRYGYTP